MYGAVDEALINTVSIFNVSNDFKYVSVAGGSVADGGHRIVSGPYKGFFKKFLLLLYSTFLKNFLKNVPKRLVTFFKKFLLLLYCCCCCTQPL